MMKYNSEMFEKFKSIQWFNVTSSQKKAVLKQYKKIRKFRENKKMIKVYFFENGIRLTNSDDEMMMPIRTTPFPILNFYT